MKLALGQIEVVSGDPVANLERMVAVIQNASSRKTDTVVFPEMSDTGYDMPTILKVASTWQEGVVPRLQRCAADFQINVVAGVSEREGAHVYNSIVVIDKEGQIVGKYRKTHLITAAPMHEERYLGSGDQLVICELDKIKMGLMTCYEIRFPEIARKLAYAGADLLVIPAAFPLVRLPHWQVLTRARAVENQVYVAATSRVGSDSPESLQFCGTSTIYDPYGTTLASASQVHEALVSAEIDVEVTENIRTQIKVHQDVREELYVKPVKHYR